MVIKYLFLMSEIRGTLNDWKIGGKNVEVINKPYFELIDDMKPIIEAQRKMGIGPNRCAVR